MLSYFKLCWLPRARVNRVTDIEFNRHETKGSTARNNWLMLNSPFCMIDLGFARKTFANLILIFVGTVVGTVVSTDTMATTINTVQQNLLPPREMLKCLPVV